MSIDSSKACKTTIVEITAVFGAKSMIWNVKSNKTGSRNSSGMAKRFLKSWAEEIIRLPRTSSMTTIEGIRKRCSRGQKLEPDSRKTITTSTSLSSKPRKRKRRRSMRYKRETSRLNDRLVSLVAHLLEPTCPPKLSNAWQHNRTTTLMMSRTTPKKSLRSEAAWSRI